jgi:two-component system, chemotaxis family, sensor kinase CheA
VIPTTIEDAALLLLQLETTDTADLAELRDALVALAFENRIPSTAQPNVARAARLLGGILDNSSKDATADFRSVNEALECAMAVETVTVAAVPAKVVVEAPALVPAAPDRPEGLPDDTDLELLRDFLNEAAEYIEASEVALLALEADPQDAEAVNTVFRAFHTVKGTAAFLGLTHIAEFAHEAESLLSRVRDREFSYGPGCADLSLRSVDMLKALLGAVENAMAEGALVRPEGYARLIAALTNYSPDQDAASVGAVPMVEAGPRAQRSESVADATIRVRTDRLDRLINMVGELVIAQTMIAGDALIANGLQPDLARKVTHAGKIVRELQELSMSMRMVPLRSTFQKLARVVRDTASKVGKSVHFTTDGDEVEIDRNLVDILADPLVHMVRNAVDHGIELPNDRTRSGKSSTGTVRLSAYHASGNVVVDLIDDGAGLDRARIVNKAIEKGLIESDRGMSDSEVFNLIFAPGFSTAEKVTDISGRGVGLDVVRRNLELIRGRLEISSSPGAGTTFSLRLPLTLAVTDGMLVRVGSERFVIPLTQIHMSFRPEPSMLSTVVGKGEMVRLRGSLMPVVRLSPAGAAGDRGRRRATHGVDG